MTLPFPFSPARIVDGLPICIFNFVRISWFGGACDTGVSPTETGALTGERLHDLDKHPGTEEPDDWFIAMPIQWAQGPFAGKSAPVKDMLRWWREQRFLVLDPPMKKAGIARPVDLGPAWFTKRGLDMGRDMMRHLGLRTDDCAWVFFAQPDMPVGPYEVTPELAAALRRHLGLWVYGETDPAPVVAYVPKIVETDPRVSEFIGASKRTTEVARDSQSGHPRKIGGRRRSFTA